MGMYVNPGNRKMQKALNDKIYVDKSEILTVLNERFDTENCFLCVSRPRRFGKTMVGNLISAFYSKGADSRAMFEKLKIAQTPNWDERLNKFNVLKIDMNAFYGRYKKNGNVITHLTADVVREMIKEFPDADIEPDCELSKAIIQAYGATEVPFVVIIDEYDVMVRERVPSAEFGEYLTLLNNLFKSDDCAEAIALAYITGIIPIVRDRIQSKLNNFKEFTMLRPQELARFIGFTFEEVKELCEQFNMDYDECLRWYDGYRIAPKVSVCNSNSVCEAMRSGQFDDYWTQTGAYTAINDYIDGNYEGIREDIAQMVGGGEVDVNPRTFLNTLDSIVSKDDVFTYLIHLGYLVYNQENKTCSIPNGEIRMEWESALKRTVNYRPIVEMIENSKRMLAATLEGDADVLAQTLDKAHRDVTSPLTYNNEGSMQSAIGLAYFYARTQYTVVKEFHSGKGYADMAFIPYVPNLVPIVVEFKIDQNPERALKQIVDNCYTDAFKDLHGPAVLVGISYCKETKGHSCKIVREEM